MSVSEQGKSNPVHRPSGRTAVIVTVVLAIAGGAYWYWREPVAAAKPKGGGPVAVVSAPVTVADLAVQLSAKGSVSAVQSVELRPQISATIKAVHVAEGQFVKQGQQLFSLDVRNEEAGIAKAEAQVAKSRVDLANAERNLQRQRELIAKNFISQSALDSVQSQVDSLRAQVAADQASAEASRVARGHGDIVAPISGRLGAIAVYPGSLVQPNGDPLVSIAQIDPINVEFALPERELVALQAGLAKGGVPVGVQLEGAGSAVRQGKLVFVDNAVDSASGTIKVKASFTNVDGRLWPGMFVTVTLSPRTLAGALTVPVQAVQTGPEKKFVYVIDQDNKVAVQPVRVALIQDGRAVVEGVAAGTRVVVEGAQNLRPGGTVSEAKNEAKPASAPAATKKQG